jgi:hypothetical protein
VAPLPLGGAYLVMARQGALVVLSEPIRLDPQSPVREVNLERPPTVDVRGTVSDEGGKPLEGAAISLECRFDLAPRSVQSSGVAAVSTDPDGKFVLGGVAVDARIGYALSVRRDGFQPAWIRDLELVDEPLDVHLERGHVLRGVVVDATGKGVGDVGLVISPAVNVPFQLPQMVRTDARGAFELNTLPEGEVIVSYQGQEHRCTTGSEEPVELRVGATDGR